MEQKILDTLSVSSLSFEDKGIYKRVVNFFWRNKRIFFSVNMEAECLQM